MKIDTKNKDISKLEYICPETIIFAIGQINYFSSTYYENGENCSSAERLTFLKLYEIVSSHIEITHAELWKCIIRLYEKRTDISMYFCRDIKKYVFHFLGYFESYVIEHNIRVLNNEFGDGVDYVIDEVTIDYFKDLFNVKEKDRWLTEFSNEPKNRFVSIPNKAIYVKKKIFKKLKMYK